MNKQIAHKNYNTLNISKIKYYSGVRNISLRAIARKLGMTPTGFNASLANSTIKATVLNEVLQILNLNYYDLVEAKPSDSKVSESNVDYNKPESLSLSQLLNERARIQRMIDDKLVDQLK